MKTVNQNLDFLKNGLFFRAIPILKLMPHKIQFSLNGTLVLCNVLRKMKKLKN